MLKTKERKVKKSLRRTLIFWFSIVSILPLVIIGVAMYYQASSSLEAEAGQKVEEFAKVQMEKLDRTLYERTRDVKGLAQDQQIMKAFKGDAQLDLTHYLDGQLEVLHYFESIALIGLDGHVVQSTSIHQTHTYDTQYAWFKEALDSGLSYSDIHYDSLLEQFVINIQTPVTVNSETVGVLYAQYNVEHIWDDVNQMVTEHSIVELINHEGMKIADTVTSASVDDDVESNQLDASSNIAIHINQANPGDSGFINDIDSLGQDSIIGYAISSGYSSYPGNNWVLLVSEPSHVILQSIDSFRNLLLFVVLGTLIAVSVLSVFISNSIVKPIIKLKNQALAIAKGHLTDVIEIKASGDVESLAEAINTMTLDLQGAIKQTSEASEHIDQQSQDLTALTGELQSGSDQLNSTMQEIASGAEHQANASADISQSSIKLDEQINQVNHLSTLLDESAKHVGQLSNDGSKQMVTSLEQMSVVNHAVKNAVEKVNEFKESSAAVSKLTGVINKITEQTHLLALNAAIESARAGEAGKGFTVVANEIRKLAQEVSLSAVDISEVIQGMEIEASDLGQSLNATSEKADKGLKEIKDSAQYFEEIKDEVAEMNKGISHIANVAEESSAGIEETTALMQQQKEVADYLSEQATRLQMLSNRLGEMVNRFEV